MARFSTVFGLSNQQASLDFVDIDLTTDTPLYLDPYAIEIRDDEWSSKCGDHIRSFFNEVMSALRAHNHPRAMHLLGNLHEPNETFLGQSSGRPQGRGVGDHKARQFADALVNSRAFVTGILSDISEAELFIFGVGPDTISDLTTNVLRGLLAEYTANQCNLHSIETHRVNSIGPAWNIQASRWEARQFMLPLYRNRPILLVPKFSVRFGMSIDSQEFYNHHMIEYLRAENLRSGSGLVHTFKDGSRTVYKSAVKAIHPFIKDDLATFVREHPEVLESYKALKGAQGSLAVTDIEKFFDERAFAQVLRDRLSAIQPGNASASEYHSVILGITTFLFHPGLIYPVKEQEIHQGRKRIDIKFTNSGESSFFDSMIKSNQARAISVAVECKNYTKEVANPELDQLSGRFGHQRGFLGFLLCRSIDDRARMIQRCRDTANDGRGYIIVLEDRDIVEMLGLVEQNRRSAINRLLQARFDELIH
ncbi:hypothetical protein FG93_04000 [Bosea sp. LC85]|uniref:hypothetical protein n=1 Tax=Bosea sp. LC85 TaxID=1502851 RepID=UPI0004E3F38B|nr:hypothetical protein [Bosea sp. LC85]KFC67264.1 hypothetical protein FG93_04000 [Bosea sp. LC85]